MKKATLRYRAERFCARLNDGLTAVAIVLAMMVFMVGTYRTLENVETAIATSDSGWNEAPDAPPQQAQN
ncbi:MAG TPA: hypothetical protein VLV50_10680 [Stellaceae bacterium]|nr:hypothetical protein [Stellaceae bacterium]